MATLPSIQARDTASTEPRKIGGGSAVAVPGVPVHAVAATALAVLGIVAIWPTVLLLWSLWTTDPLKSIGGLVPLVSLVLLLRVWRAQGWQARGSWWGLALLAGTIGAVHLRERAILELVLTPSWTIFLPPHSLVAFAYGSGMVLLFGGGRLWRAAWFPVLLLLLVNPVPHAFTRFVDLPLQHVSAGVARALAHALGQRLTPDQLYLMFTPEFGMFIAPGCDGIRGSITMGFIALVAGYVYRFRARAWALAIAAAVLLGYAFNLLRLCVLVVYYVVALHWRMLQGHAEMGDYCIGATLFFFATMLLFAVVRRCSPGRQLRLPGSRVPASPQSPLSRSFWWRWSALAVLLGVGAAPYARGVGRARPAEEARVSFPAAIGPYRLRRTWPETLLTGQTIFSWAEYGVPGGSYAVQVGVSPNLGAHDTLLCHAARGEDWTWQGAITFSTADGPVNFSGSLFNDGATEFLEATTVCTEGRCGQWTSERQHFGLIYSRPAAHGLLQDGAPRPVPVLLRVETPDATLPANAARLQLTGELRAFLAQASFHALIPARAHP